MHCCFEDGKSHVLRHVDNFQEQRGADSQQGNRKLSLTDTRNWILPT